MRRTTERKSEPDEGDDPLPFEQATELNSPEVKVAAKAGGRSPGEGLRPTRAAPIVTTLPEIHEARAVAAQRAHHKGALVAFACLAVVWFGLRILSEHVLPPAIPPTPKGALASAMQVPGSAPIASTPEGPRQTEPAAAPSVTTSTPLEGPRPIAEPERMLADSRREPPAKAAESQPLPTVATVDPSPRTVASLSEIIPAPSSLPAVSLQPRTAPAETATPAAPPTAASPPPPTSAEFPLPAATPAPSATTPPAGVNTSPPLATAIPPTGAVPSSPPVAPAPPPGVAASAPLAVAAAIPPPITAAPAVSPAPASVATLAPRRAEPVPSSRPPKVGQRWTNSLAMPFAPIPKLPILVAIWETRRRDFDAFVKATGAPRKGAENRVSGEHPVTDVSFLDATLFCEWLTTADIAAGRLKAPQHYRLPTDAEWSAAAGIPAEPGATLRERDDPADRTFAWGNQWPPPPGAGNFRGVHAPEIITDADSYEQAAPVGTFAPNRLGLFDLGGNAAEMVSDLIAPELGLHATRGASFADADERTLRLRARGVGENDRGSNPHVGFRIVLDLAGTN